MEQLMNIGAAGVPRTESPNIFRHLDKIFYSPLISGQRTLYTTNSEVEDIIEEYTDLILENTPPL